MTPRRLTDAEPLDLDHVKAHLRVDHGFEDAVISAYAAAAVAYLEAVTDRQFGTAQMRRTTDRWGALMLCGPSATLKTVDAVAYSDAANAPQTLAPSEYEVLGSLIRFPGYLPALYDRRDAVQITYTVDNPMPEPIRQAALLLTGAWHDARTEFGAGELSFGVRLLIQPYRQGGV